MALRVVTESPKFGHLKGLLRRGRFSALGALESVWHFCGKFTPQGDIGKYSDGAIEGWVEWDGEPGALIAALVESHWLDADPLHRLIVHDWHIHADRATREALRKAGLRFADCAPTCADAQNDRADCAPTCADAQNDLISTRARSAVGQSGSTSSLRSEEHTPQRNAPVVTPATPEPGVEVCLEKKTGEPESADAALAELVAELAKALKFEKYPPHPGKPLDPIPERAETEGPTVLRKNRFGRFERVKSWAAENEEFLQSHLPAQRAEPVPALPMAPAAEAGTCSFLAVPPRNSREAPKTPPESPAALSERAPEDAGISLGPRVATNGPPFAAYWQVFVDAGKTLSDRDRTRTEGIWRRMRPEARAPALADAVRKARDGTWPTPEFTAHPVNHLRNEAWTAAAVPRKLPVFERRNRGGGAYTRAAFMTPEELRADDERAIARAKGGSG